MYSMVYDEEKATTKMKRTIAMIERALDGAEIDWSKFYRRIPHGEEWELVDWARTRLETLGENVSSNGSLSPKQAVLNRVIAEVFAYEGNPHPLADYLALTEPDSPEALMWTERSAEMAALLPDSRALSRDLLPCLG